MLTLDRRVRYGNQAHAREASWISWQTRPPLRRSPSPSCKDGFQHRYAAHPSDQAFAPSVRSTHPFAQVLFLFRASVQRAPPAVRSRSLAAGGARAAGPAAAGRAGRERDAAGDCQEAAGGLRSQGGARGCTQACVQDRPGPGDAAAVAGRSTPGRGIGSGAGRDGHRDGSERRCSCGRAGHASRVAAAGVAPDRRAAGLRCRHHGGGYRTTASPPSNSGRRRLVKAHAACHDRHAPSVRPRASPPLRCETRRPSR